MLVLAAYIAQGVSSDLREDAFRKIQTFHTPILRNLMQGILLFV